MNIVPKLNLNRHNKDCINLSLVNGQNMKVSNDESSITSEDGIRENTFIHNFLITYYTEISYTIVGTIACNNELVIIVKPEDTEFNSDIFRYQEPINNNTEQMYCAYGGITSDNRFKYQGGKIKGVFTYNVENSLVVAITEYGVVNVKIPLRTINLGNFNDNTIYNDNSLSNSKLSISPEVKLPIVKNLDYVSGGAYKGWYYIFIRYKINSIDYSQWYSIGTPIYVDSIEQYQIIRYCYNRDTKFGSTPLGNLVSPPNPDDGYGAGFSDYFSNTSDIAKETFQVDLYFNNTVDFEKYQIGIICASKTTTKAFRTADIFLTENYIVSGSNYIQQYTLDNKSLEDYNITDLITDNFNYFNSENIFNYQNRVYISNYLENNANDDNISQTIIDNIDVELIRSSIRDYGLVYDVALISNANNGVNQYDSYDMTLVPLSDYLNISKETIITVSASGCPTKTAKVGQFYISSNNVTPAFGYIELREPGPLSSVIITNYGKDPDKTGVHLAIPSEDGNISTDILIDTNALGMSGGVRYTNTNIDFKTRRKESTLIPGEIYNLFIHYTNKYSNATNGYRINNKTIWDTIDNVGVEIIPISFNIKVGSDIVIYYASIPVNDNVSKTDITTDNGYSLNITNIKFYKGYIGTQLNNKVSLGEITDCTTAFNEQFSSYSNVKFISSKWYQISYGPSGNDFHLFINNNGDRLFKIPIVESFTLGWDGFPNEVEEFKTYNNHTLLRIAVNNVEIPIGYDGFYISYEKYEPQIRATGMLTRNDFKSQDYIVVGSDISTPGNINTRKSDKMFFYSSVFDISDTIKLDYSIMRIEAINPYKKQDIPEWDYFQRNWGFSFVHDQNKPQTETYGTGVNRTYAIPDYKVVVADSAVDNRMGLGTALQLRDSYSLFPSYNPDSTTNNKVRQYRVSILNTTRDVYMSNTKTLVRLTDIYYRNESFATDFKYSTGYIDTGYNGHYTYDGVIIYENAGITFNTTTNKVTGIMHNLEFYKTAVPDETPHTYQNDIPFAAYLQFPICSDIFFESKSFKSAPTPIIYVVIGTTDHNKFAKGSMVTPVNTIDLFENKQGTTDQFNPKTYTNFRFDLVSIERFDKTVRRSNVIQDESRLNGWRTFPIEAYKNITENKGKITNIIGVGFVLLVHTEHSLFMFNTNNNIQTKDKDLQLSQPDVFDVQYNEVFTSDKGFGGLQDDLSYLIDTFGYIFYSVDTNRIYLFDNGQLGNIDTDIIEWLFRYKPFNVRMANDKKNHRILIKFDYIINDILKHTVISYNYNTKSFITQHGYYFDQAFNTKTNLYMQCDNTHNGCSLHSFVYDGSLYGQYDNVLSNIGVPTILPSKLSIIVNISYDNIKFLEFINYKLTKYVNDINADFTHSPVEEYIEPFAGNNISVYNNQINTGVLNINVNTEDAKNIFANFAKPYWDLGVWNFSYLFNRISELNDGVSANDMSRLFGNYFIVEFTFTNTDNRRIDFEELNYQLSENI